MTNSPSNLENNLASSIARAIADLTAAANEAAEKLAGGPDNPAIKRSGPRTLTIAMKDMGLKNWTPFYHDWKAQYNELAEMLRAHRFAAVADAATTGSIKSKGGKRDLAPEVVQRLRAIIGDVREVLDAAATPVELPDGAKKKAPRLS